MGDIFKLSSLFFSLFGQCSWVCTIYKKIYVSNFLNELWCFTVSLWNVLWWTLARSFSKSPGGQVPVIFWAFSEVEFCGLIRGSLNVRRDGRTFTRISCCCWVTSVVSDSVQPHRRQPTRLPRPWDSPGKNTGVGCHFLLQCMKVKSESEVAQLCPTPSDPMDCSPPGSSVHGIFQARVLEWGAIAFSSHFVRTTTSTGNSCKMQKYVINNKA